MRTVKNADERKDEILEVALNLFLKKGFDATSMNDIIAEVGIAKGTLYYHFKSKESIMDTLVDQVNNKIIEVATVNAMDTTKTVQERLLNTLLSLNAKEEKGQEEMLVYMHKPQNILLHHKSQYALLKSIPPILSEIIKDGISQGLFDTAYPLECIEMVLAYSSTVLDDMFGLSQEEQFIKVQALVYHLDRMLGAKESLLPMVMKIFMENHGDE